MSNELMPLYYAILKQFMDGKEYSADEIIDALITADRSARLADNEGGLF